MCLKIADPVLVDGRRTSKLGVGSELRVLVQVRQIQQNMDWAEVVNK